MRFECAADGSVVPLLTEDLVLPLSCFAHYTHATIDYVMYTSVYFKTYRRNGA